MATLAPEGTPGLMGYLRSQVELPEIPTYLWEEVMFHIYQASGRRWTTYPLPYWHAHSYELNGRSVTIRPATRWRNGTYRLRLTGNPRHWVTGSITGEPLEFDHLHGALTYAVTSPLVGRIEVFRKVSI